MVVCRQWTTTDSRRLLHRQRPTSARHPAGESPGSAARASSSRFGGGLGNCPSSSLPDPSNAWTMSTSSAEAAARAISNCSRATPRPRPLKRHPAELPFGAGPSRIVTARRRGTPPVRPLPSPGAGAATRSRDVAWPDGSSSRRCRRRPSYRGRDSGMARSPGPTPHPGPADLTDPMASASAAPSGHSRRPRKSVHIQPHTMR